MNTKGIIQDLKNMKPIREDFLEKVGSKEILGISQVLDRVEEFGLTVEVVYSALRIIKENKCITPLLALQIAMEDWDC